MIFTKCFTSSGPRRILPLLLALAVLVSFTAVPVAATVHTEGQIGHSAAPSDGEECIFDTVYMQGFFEGYLDGFCGVYDLEKRLKQHHYNNEQRLTYTDGYNSGYFLGSHAIIW